MRSRATAAAIGAVLMGALAMSVGVARGAAPTGNGLYSGTVTANGYHLKVEVHVAASGKTATARFYCNGTTLPTSPQDNAKFPVTNGAFSGQTRYGIYGIKGTFTSTTTANATMHVQGTCSTSSAANYKLTLRLSSK